MRHLLPRIGEPVLEVLKILEPHFDEIRTIWKQSMLSLNLGFDAGEIDALACLTLEAHDAVLRTGKAAAYRKALERCGQSLERSNVPPVHAMIAQSCYLESCCILLLNLSICNAETTTALAHLNSVSQAFVIAGYSEQRSTANSLELVEKERRRFSQDLHDEIGQGLIVLKLYLESLTKSYKEGNREGVLAKLEESMSLVGECRTSVRRLILDLGPAVLDQLGLLASFKAYATQFSERTGIKVEVRADDIPQLPRMYQATLFRVLQGALSNVAQHSNAKRVQITARTIKGSIIKMTIEDNGVGFVTAKHGFGITAMQERVEKLGGQFCLKSRQASSTSRRSGTRIDVSLPLSDCESAAGVAQLSPGTLEIAAGVVA